MRSLPSRVLSVAELPPLPATPRERHLVAREPEGEGTYLVLDVEGRTMWRVDSNGHGAMLASLTYPEHLDPLYLYCAHFYEDSARGQLVFLASTYDSNAPNGLFLLAWDGEKLLPIVTENGLQVASSDAFVFDPARAVLVHFVGQGASDVARDAERKRRGGLTVRELGRDGVWRDLDTKLPTAGRGAIAAGYEPRRKLAVLVDDSTRHTFGWDGHSFTPLEDFPDAPTDPRVLVPTAAGTLLYLHAQRSNEDHRARLWELTAAGWRARSAGALEVFGGALFDEARGETRIFGPWFGPGTVQHAWATFERRALTPSGAAVPTITAGSTAGAPRFWGAHDPRHGHADVEARRPYAALVVHAAQGAALVPREVTPPALALVTGPRRTAAVDFRGRLLVPREGEWVEEGEAPSGFVERESALVGTDARGRVLVVGGEPSAGGKRLMDTWLYDGALRELTPKGGAPLAVGAHVARDEVRGVWVVCGGTLKYEPSTKLYELSEKKWASYPAQTSAGAPPGVISLLAWDGESEQLLAVASADHGATHALYVVRPRGVLEAATALEGPLGVLAYDTERRTIVSYQAGHSWEEGRFAMRAKLAEIEVGAALDDARPRRAFSEPPPSLSLPDHVWLELREQQTRSFWFSARAGKSVTITAGRRGTPGKVTTTTHGSVAAARGAHEKGVAERLEEGYEHSPEKAACATIPGRRAYLLKLGAKGDDLFGGLAPGVTRDTWPSCAECNHPMTHVLTLHAHPARLPLRAHAALSVFVCGNEETAGDCEVWEPGDGANAVLLLTAEDLARPPLRKPPKSASGEEASPVCKPKKVSYREVFEEDPATNEDREPTFGAPKVGGYPAWRTHAAPPSCRVCEAEMRFAAQLDRLDDAVNFAGGTAYVFLCEEEHEAALLCQR